MQLEEYMRMTGMKIGDFCKKINISQPLIFRYRKRTLRPSFHHAIKICDFSNGLIKMEELGWMPNGEKIKPWTKKELKNNLNSDGMSNNNPLSPHPMDSPEKEGKDLLQPEGQGEKERHCVG